MNAGVGVAWVSVGCRGGWTVGGRMVDELWLKGQEEPREGDLVAGSPRTAVYTL